MKKQQSFLFLLALVMCLTFLPYSASAAAKKPSLPSAKNLYGTQYDNKEPWLANGFFKIKNLSKNAKVTSIKTSKAPAGVQFYATMVSKDFPTPDGKTRGYLYVSSEGLAPGKSFKVNVTIKQNKKTYKLTTKFKIVKRPSPFKSFKINGTEYASYFNGTEDLHLPANLFRKKTLTIYYSLKNGVKIASDDNAGSLNILNMPNQPIKAKKQVSVTTDWDTLPAGTNPQFSLLIPIRYKNQEMEKPSLMPFKYEVFTTNDN